MRKGNKKFAVFDLQVTLAWEGSWVDGDVKVGALQCVPCPMWFRKAACWFSVA